MGGLNGARVLAVAAHGYPAYFLAEGAATVTSFDISHEANVWNAVVRTTLQLFDYDVALQFFGNSDTPPSIPHSKTYAHNVKAVMGHLALPQDDIDLARNLYEYYRSWRDREPKRSFSDGDSKDASFLSSEERYLNASSSARQDDGWIILSGNLFNMLPKLCTENSPPFNFAFLSNIRSWTEMLLLEDKDYPTDQRSLNTAAMALKLGVELDQLIDHGGSIHESMPLTSKGEHLPDIHFAGSVKWETSYQTLDGSRNIPHEQLENFAEYTVTYRKSA